MSGEYEDLIHLPYPGTSSRKRMSMTDRAAQFSPFSALTGYEEAIQETGRLTDPYRYLDADEKAVLNEKICLLMDFQEKHPEITLTCFVPDERKSGGAYERLTGRVKKVDEIKQVILMTDGTAVNFSRIRDLGGEIFQQYEGRYLWE